MRTLIRHVRYIDKEATHHGYSATLSAQAQADRSPTSEGLSSMAKKIIKVTTDPDRVGRRKNEPSKTAKFTDRQEAQKWALEQDLRLLKVSKPTLKRP